MPGWQDFTSLSQTFLSSDLLLSDLSGVLNTSLTYLPVIEHGIGALSVSLTAQVAGTITVTVTDASGIVPTWTDQQVATGFGDVLQFVVPYSYTTISALNVKVTSSVNQVHNCPTFIIGYGGTINDGGGSQLIRPDGRAYPTGANVANVSIGASGTSALIAAPAAGVHILVKSLMVNNSVAASTTALSGTVGGVARNLLVVRGVGIVSQDYGSGILLDAATALNLVSGANGVGDSVAVYDLAD